MGSEGFTTAGWVVRLVKDPPLLVRAQSKKITFAADRSADRSAERGRTRTYFLDGDDDPPRLDWSTRHFVVYLYRGSGVTRNMMHRNTVHRQFDFILPSVDSLIT